MASSAVQTSQAGVSSRALSKVIIDDTTVFQNLDLGGTTLKGLHLKNASGAAIGYFHLYDSKTPVLGTTAQSAQIPLAISQELTVFVVQGGSFATGLSIAATSDKGTAAVAAPNAAVTGHFVSLPT